MRRVAEELGQQERPSFEARGGRFCKADRAGSAYSRPMRPRAQTDLTHSREAYERNAGVARLLNVNSGPSSQTWRSAQAISRKFGFQCTQMALCSLLRQIVNGLQGTEMLTLLCCCAMGSDRMQTDGNDSLRAISSMKINKVNTRTS